MEENLWWEVFFNSQETEDMIMAAFIEKLLNKHLRTIIIKVTVYNDFRTLNQYI